MWNGGSGYKCCCKYFFHPSDHPKPIIKMKIWCAPCIWKIIQEVEEWCVCCAIATTVILCDVMGFCCYSDVMDISSL